MIKILHLLNAFRMGLLLKVSIIAVLTTTFTLSVFGLYQHTKTASRMVASLEERVLLAAKRLSGNLKEPVFHYNKDTAQDIIFAEMESELIAGIFVLENEKAMPGFAFSRNEFGSPVPSETLLSENDYIVASRKIKRQAEIVGEVRVFASRRSLDAELAQMSVSAVIQILVLDILIVLVLILSMRVLITMPVAVCVNSAQIMSRGDLSQMVSIVNKDEIGDLAGAVNNMTLNLAEMFREIADGIGVLTANSEELFTLSQQMSAGAEQTTLKSDTVAEATKQMSFNINTIASAAEQMSLNIANISTTAEEMSQNMRSVASAIEEMTVAIKDIAGNAREAAYISQEAMDMADNAVTTINILGEAAMEIDEVTEVIRKIAEQTNLLAINATIEAASAGESGKGFAVVANEIKVLARQSSRAAENIIKRIGHIQKNTIQAVQVIEGVSDIIGKINDSTAIITKAVEQQTLTSNEISANVNQASKGVTNIASSVAEVAKGSDDMSGNAGQAAGGISEVALNIEGVSEAAREASGRARQVSLLSEELAGVAAQLRKTISKFKIRP